MIYVELFIAFFLPGILGYGGGPSSIPLIEDQVVGKYGWYSVQEFSNMLALGNTLPGPIATKMAGYIGYDIGGVLGALVAIIATVVPSLILMMILLGLLHKYKDSKPVKGMSIIIRPVITVLLGVMTYNFFATAVEGGIEILNLILLTVLSSWLMIKKKVNPAYVICGALIYGAVFMG